VLFIYLKSTTEGPPRATYIVGSTKIHKYTYTYNTLKYKKNKKANKNTLKTKNNTKQHTVKQKIY